MTIKNAYDQWSMTYDSDENLTRDLDAAVTRELLSNVRCMRVVEIGIGTGKNTPLFAQIGERVLGIDFSERMLSKARAKLQLANVRLVLADITQSWPLKDGWADLIACNLVLEHIEDLEFIFSEARRVLSDPGVLFICELHPYWQYQGVQARFQQGKETAEVGAFTHNISDFTRASEENQLRLEQFNEWWHEEDLGKPPRLASFMFEKRQGQP